MDKKLKVDTEPVAEEEIKSITDLPFPGWKDPKPITKLTFEKAIEEYMSNPENLKEDRSRWPDFS